MDQLWSLFWPPQLRPNVLGQGWGAKGDISHKRMSSTRGMSQVPTEGCRFQRGGLAGTSAWYLKLFGNALDTCFFILYSNQLQFYICSLFSRIKTVCKKMRALRASLKGRCIMYHVPTDGFSSHLVAVGSSSMSGERSRKLVAKKTNLSCASFKARSKLPSAAAFSNCFWTSQVFLFCELNEFVFAVAFGDWSFMILPYKLVYQLDSMWPWVLECIKTRASNGRTPTRQKGEDRNMSRAALVSTGEFKGFGFYGPHPQSYFWQVLWTFQFLEDFGQQSAFTSLKSDHKDGQSVPSDQITASIKVFVTCFLASAWENSQGLHILRFRELQKFRGQPFFLVSDT